MLAPDDRQLLVEALTPPDGYRFDQGVGTTFSLDLVALLRVPLAFTVFDWQQEDGRPTADPHALLAALRQYADRLTIFCQAGQIAVPQHDHRLLSQLEDAVVEARSPTDGGVFHPKVWALRYVAPDEPTLYRLLVLSRNLTFDRSWDTALVLDGELTNSGRPIVSSRPVSEFVAALEGCAVSPLSEAATVRVRTIAQDLARVRWDLPPDFESVVFHPIGHDGRPVWPFSGDIRRLLVISPFLSASALDRLAHAGNDHQLISRLETLARLSADELASFEPIQVFDDALQPDDDVHTFNAASDAAADEAALDPGTELTGLHAKVYVADAGWKARIWVGSANATHAAFNRNVEFLAELEGPKSRCGIDAVLGDAHSDRSLGSLLRRYELPGEQVEVDAVLERLHDALQHLRRDIACADLVAEVAAEESGHYALTLTMPTLSTPPTDAEVLVRPITLTQAQKITATSTWHALPTELLTAFFAFEITIRAEGRVASTGFVTRADLRGAPADRRESLLRALLRDKSQVLRFLLLLLADSARSADSALNALAVFREGARAETAGQWQAQVPLLETMLKALDRDPDTLQQVEGLIADLSSTADGAELLPDGLLEIWQPIRDAMTGP
ncbi:MAG TPA: phospholipase D family protein [Solirubrobacteraceae bacterium]|jgi:hypothetical protein